MRFKKSIRTSFCIGSVHRSTIQSVCLIFVQHHHVMVGYITTYQHECCTCGSTPITVAVDDEKRVIESKILTDLKLKKYVRGKILKQRFELKFRTTFVTLLLTTQKSSTCAHTPRASHPSSLLHSCFWTTTSVY